MPRTVTKSEACGRCGKKTFRLYDYPVGESSVAVCGDCWSSLTKKSGPTRT